MAPRYTCSATASPLPDQKIDRPATANVWTRPSQVAKDVAVSAPGVLQCVRQDSQPRGVQMAAGQEAVLVGIPGKTGDGPAAPGEPGRLDGAVRPEEHPEDVAPQTHEIARGGFLLNLGSGWVARVDRPNRTANVVLDV